MSNDGIHLSQSGINKVCRCLKTALNLPAVKKKDTRLTHDGKASQSDQLIPSVAHDTNSLNLSRTSHPPLPRPQGAPPLPSVNLFQHRHQPQHFPHYSPPNLNWQEQRSMIATILQEILPSMLAQQRQQSPHVPSTIVQDQNVHVPQIPSPGIWPPPVGLPPPQVQQSQKYWNVD